MFIAFEGGDAAGKSTVSLHVANRLEERGWPITSILKRGGQIEDRFVAERLDILRQALWDYPREAPISTWGNHHWLYLQSAWFSLLDEAVVKPALDATRIVMIDNWCFKILARYLAKTKFCPDVAHGAFSHLSRPDIVVWLDVEPEEALGRRPNFSPSEAGVFDGNSGCRSRDFIDYQGAVRAQFVTMAKADDWMRVETSGKNEESVNAEVAERIDGKLKSIGVTEWRNKQHDPVSRRS